METWNREMLLRLIRSEVLPLVDDINKLVAERTGENKSYLNAPSNILPITLSEFYPTTSVNTNNAIEIVLSRRLVSRTLRNLSVSTASYLTWPTTAPIWRALLISLVVLLLSMMPGMDSKTRTSCSRDFSGFFRPLFLVYLLLRATFSMVKYEKTNNRMNLADLSLKGILHAKQYYRMRCLNVWIYCTYWKNNVSRKVPNFTSHVAPNSVIFRQLRQMPKLQWSGHQRYGLLCMTNVIKVV